MASVVLVGTVVLAHHAYKSYKTRESRKMDAHALRIDDAYASDDSLGSSHGDAAGEHPPGYEEALRTKRRQKRQSLRAMWPLSKRKETQRL